MMNEGKKKGSGICICDLCLSLSVFFALWGMTVSCVDNQRLLNHNTGMCCCVQWPYVWESCSEAALNPELALFVGPVAANQTAVEAAEVPIRIRVSQGLSYVAAPLRVKVCVYSTGC